MSLRDTESGRRTGPIDGGAAPRSCASFEDVLPLLHDHELSLAEAAALEMHLAGCAACQAHADAYEKLSSVLKRWDAAPVNHPPIPHVRMQHEVLARVAEHGAHRRAADRTVRYLRWATAASIVLTLGIATALGLRGGSDTGAGDDATLAADASAQGPRWPADKTLAALPPMPEYDPLELPSQARGIVPGSGFEDRLAPLPAAPDWGPMPDFSEVSRRRLARLNDIGERVQALSGRLGGEATVWFGIDGRGLHMIGRDALAYLHQSGILARWQQQMERAQTALLTTSAPAPVVGTSDETPRDLLAGVPGLVDNGNSMANLHSVGGVYKRVPGLRTGGVPQQMLRGHGLKTQDGGGATWMQGLDPLVAQREGRLWFSETHRFDTVVAFVKGTDKPIYIPDGQLLLEGAKDRVVAEPVWLPASKTEQRFAIPCRVVQRGTRRDATSRPVLSPWIAGPTVRSLLRRDASNGDLLDAIAAQLRVADPVRFQGTFASWSLADLPEAVAVTPTMSFGQHAERHRDSVRASFRKNRLQGFVAEGSGPTPRQEALYGIEISRLQGDAGEALLSRLYLSYVLESLVTRAMRRNAVLGSFHRPAPRVGSYMSLRLEKGGMDEHVSSLMSHRLRALRRSIEVAPQRHLQIETLDIDGTAAHVSVTSDGARER